MLIRSAILVALFAVGLNRCLGAADQAAELQETARAFVAHMAAGEFDQATLSFDEAMTRAMPAAKLKDAWDNVISVYGPFQRSTETKSQQVKQFEAVFVTCDFQQGRLDAKVVFSADHKITGLFFVPCGTYKPPAYIDSAKFEERELQIGTGIWSLPGTLSLPKQAGSVAALILVHGSGPQDRDETIGPNKPFRDLAQGLASRGIAVLRYEKRTRQHPTLTGLVASSITVKEETIDDVLAAVEALGTVPEIDPQRIFVLGHSLGGTVLPRIAKANHAVAGFISLAGSTRPLEDVVLEQFRYVLSLDDKLTEDEQQKIKEIEQQVAKVKSPTLSERTPGNELPLGIPAKYWLDLRENAPAAVAQGLSKPMLILQGERDYQVTMEDYAGWKKALAARKNVEFITYPALNHLFIAGDGKSTPAEYFIPGNVAQVVVDDIANWIARQPPSPEGKHP